MKSKENKGGILSNEKLEQDLEIRKRNGATDSRGVQDKVQREGGLGKPE